MTRRGSQFIHDGAGRIELCTNANRKIPINLTHVLADGSRLTDPPNRKLLDTILGVVAESQPRLGGGSPAAIIGTLYLLVQWMFVRSIYSFGSLQSHHYQAFIVDSSKGLDVVIDATPRLHSYLTSLVDLPTHERLNLKPQQILTGAGIPHSYSPRLPRAVKLATEFVARGQDALTDGPIEPEVRKVGTGTLHGRVQAIQRLWTLRDGLSDAAQVCPFPDDVFRLVRQIGRPKRQTEIVPHTVALRLLVGSMDMVMSLGPLFLEWMASRASGKEHSQLDAHKYEQLRLFVEHRTGLKLVRAVRMLTSASVATISIERKLLPIACQVAVLAYTGRRKVEVETLQANCIKGTQEEGRHLSAYIAKRQSFESRPCPELVARAIDLMNRYHGYEPTEGNLVFNQRGKLVPMRLVEQLDEFAKFVGASTCVDDEGRQRTWHWKAHQLRRLYAIYYIWRYEDSSLLALQHHFGHGNEREAAYYARLASDEDFADLVQEAGLFTLERLREIARGEAGFAGAFAHVVSKRIERARINLRLTSPKSLDSVLRHLVEDEGLVMHAGPWGFCGCRPTASNMRRAKCRQGERDQRPKHPIFNTPIPESSNEETCASCHFHATNASREPHWRNVVLRLDNAVRGGRQGSMAVDVLRQRWEKVDAAAERFFGPGARIEAKGKQLGASSRCNDSD